MSSVLVLVDAVSLLFSFFFSSRRRHTRSLRDWSSDVCSSDLFTRFSMSGESQYFTLLPKASLRTAIVTRAKRSEERRVGKECRSRWWTYHKTKNRGLGSHPNDLPHPDALFAHQRRHQAAL